MSALRDVEGFAAGAVRSLPALVPADIASYTVVDRRRWRIAVEKEPSDAGFPDADRVFERHMHEHPVLAYCLATDDAPALRISDFLTRREFRRTALYNEFFRRIGTEHQLVARVPAGPPLVIGMALHRKRREFTERERLLVNLLRPHLSQAYRNAVVASQWREAVGLITRGLEALGAGVAVLEPNGRVRFATARARHWLAAYFAPGRRAGALPEELTRWVRDQEAALSVPGDVPPVRAPLVVERGAHRLVVRLIGGTAERLLLLDEHATAVSAAALEPLGLSRREAEVLAWLAEGKSNAEIGTILGARPGTVAKHLQRVYVKLGVETRTAAVARALAALQPGGALG
jgi:DNA-binding CsgD family transcriptional regulator